MAGAGDRFDVAILGGGLAGLSLAIQMMRRRPATSIVVLEKNPHPVPEAAHKVGESTLNIGARYFDKVIAMRPHLEKHQLRKMGLRYFLADQAGPDIMQRTETGLTSFEAAVRQYQLDRGRFENALGEEAERLGVTFMHSTRVGKIEFGEGDEDHTVAAKREDEEFTVSAKWVVDAAGRAGILKRKFDLKLDNTHHCNAAWFRIGKRIKIDDWSDDPAYRERVPNGCRWNSTNHFVGAGYWFWVIPLASDSTSFGLVADPDLVPWDDMRSMDTLMDWLREHEPHAAAMIEPDLDALQDFKYLKHFSHDCKQVYSRDRWCITGEAGHFMDPLYSPGSDAICMSNTCVTRIVTESLDGMEVGEKIDFLNTFYLGLARSLVPIWDHQYPIFGNPTAAAIKFAWDYVPYVSAIALMAATERLDDPELMTTLLPDLARVNAVGVNMQRYLRDWVELHPDAEHVIYPAVTDEAYRRYESDFSEAKGDDDEWIRSTMRRNLGEIEATAIDIIERTAPALGVELGDEPVNPYTFSLRGPDSPPAEPVGAFAVPVMEEFEPIGGPEAKSALCWASPDEPQTPATVWGLWRPPAVREAVGAEAAAGASE